MQKKSIVVLYLNKLIYISLTTFIFFKIIYYHFSDTIILFCFVCYNDIFYYINIDNISQSIQINITLIVSIIVTIFIYNNNFWKY